MVLKKFETWTAKKSGWSCFFDDCFVSEEKFELGLLSTNICRVWSDDVVLKHQAFYVARLLCMVEMISWMVEMISSTVGSGEGPRCRGTLSTGS